MPKKETQKVRDADGAVGTGGLLVEDDNPHELLSLVVHELRNPLCIAMGHLELVQADCDDEHLQTVAQALDRMESLVDDFETIIDSGAIIKERHPISLRNLVTDSWNNITAEEASLEIETTTTIQADPDRLQEVLENLLRNAVEHGGADVSITIGDLADRSGFYVADDGPGIPSADYETVFEWGYTTHASGSGFGLWIVETFVAAHGWSITVTESATGGTRFEIHTQNL
jgi:signal transduction histidine kinase